MKKTKCFKRAVAMLLVTTMMVQAVPENVKAEESEMMESSCATETVTTVADTDVAEVTDAAEVVESVLPTETTIVGDGYSVHYLVEYQWDGYCNVTVSIYNTGTANIENWALQYYIDGEIENLWNAYVYETREGNYTFKNLGWNQDIAVGENVSFGYTLKTEKHILPEAALLIGNKCVVEENRYDFEYQVTNSWGSGLNGAFTINNNSDIEIEDWIIEFDYPNEIINIDKAQIIEHTGNHYVIKNPAYSQNLAVNTSMSISIVANVTDSTNEYAVMEHIKMYEIRTNNDATSEQGVSIGISGFGVDEETGYYTINEFTDTLSGTILSSELVVNAEVIVRNDKDKILLAKDFVPEENYIIRDMGFMLGNNHIEVVVEYADGTKETAAMSVVNYIEENMTNLDVDFTDIDGDSLDGYLEELYGTNPEKYDTDEDGLSDYEELVVIGTDPLKKDTDDNGVVDGDEDAEGDGVSNLLEILTGTSNISMDSDFDGLSDYDEINVHGTNPCNEDTDSDGADDYWEVMNGFDATLASETFTVDETIEGIDTKVEIEVTADGESITTYYGTVREYDDFYFNPLIRGYIGSGYDFQIEGELQSATIKYYFDADYISENFEPVIYYYNEEEQCLEEIPTVWDGTSNFVTASLPHFSTYVLLNKVEFDKVWNEEIKNSGVSGVDNPGMNVVFVVDNSGSMTYSKRLSTTKLVLKEFLNALDENDRAGLVTFTSYAEMKSALTNNYSILKTKIDSMSAWGLTAIYSGIDCAIDMLVTDNSNRKNVVIVVTDGYDEPSTTYSNYYSDIVNKASQNNVMIYTIGIQTIDEALLTKVAESTGGKYYYASVVEDLNNNFGDIKGDIDKKTDSNDDGLSDYYTRLICSGVLTTKTGSRIFARINYEDILMNDDYDGDGLLNGEEILIKTDDKLHMYIEVLSDFTKADSDGDGMNDLKEIENGSDPMCADVTVVDMDFLLNDDIYLSGQFNKQYESSALEKFNLYTGNLILNTKLSYKNDYIVAYLRYIQSYIDVYGESIYVNQIKELYKKDLNEKLWQLTNIIIPTIEAGLGNSDLYYKLINARKGIDDALEIVENISSLSEFEAATGKIAFSYESMMEYVNNAYQNYGELLLELDNAFYGRFADKINQFYVSYADYVKYIYTNYNGLIGGIDVLLTVKDGMDNAIETSKLYGALYYDLEIYEDINRMLSHIYWKGDNYVLDAATTEVRLAILHDSAVVARQAYHITTQFAEDVSPIVISAFAEKMGYFAWSIDVGIAIAKLWSNNDKVYEEALKVIAYAESASAVAQGMKANLSVTSDGRYYKMSDDLKKDLEMLAELRIVAEDQFAYTSNLRSWLKQAIDNIFSESQSEINAYCRAIIMDICERFSLYAAPFYRYSYLY